MVTLTDVPRLALLQIQDCSHCKVVVQLGQFDRLLRIEVLAMIHMFVAYICVWVHFGIFFCSRGRSFIVVLIPYCNRFWYGPERRLCAEQLQRCCFVELAFEMPIRHQAFPTITPEPDVRITNSGGFRDYYFALYKARTRMSIYVYMRACLLSGLMLLSALDSDLVNIARIRTCTQCAASWACLTYL